MRTLVDWLRDLFQTPEVPRPLTPNELHWQAFERDRWRREEDYRAAFGPLVSRGRSLAEGLNAGLGLPHGTVVFDDSELRAAHAWAGRDR